MDEQERLAQAVEEVLKAHREARAWTAMGLALEILANNPSAPKVRREQSAYVAPTGPLLDDPDDGFANLIRLEHRKRLLILITLGIIIAIAFLSPLGLLLLL
jgi:hypothetical protein